MSVTRLGVSLLNVVATMESPASHHGTERPDAKNSEVFLDDRLPKKSAGAKQITTARIAIIQSIALRCIVFHPFVMERGDLSPPFGCVAALLRMVPQTSSRPSHANTCVATALPRSY
jgi:hypothetical protein